MHFILHGSILLHMCTFFQKTENWKWLMIFLPENLSTFLPLALTFLLGSPVLYLAVYQKFRLVMTEISLSFTVRSHSHFLQSQKTFFIEICNGLQFNCY